jgi:hypothetical protein
MIDNSQKIILDLCGGTGAWSRPYREAGYDVRVITLPKWDVLRADYCRPGSNMIFKRQSPESLYKEEYPDMIIPVANVYGILAAPPCTEFSRAKTTAPRDFAKGMETVRACMEIIWYCQTHGKLKFWELENPDGLLYRFLGKAAYKFEHWQFGGEIEKPTCLWGVFKPPVPTVTLKPEIAKYIQHSERKRVNHNSKFYANPPVPEEYRAYIASIDGYTAKRAAARAITPSGFAEAFYRANGQEVV